LQLIIYHFLNFSRLLPITA